MRARTPRTPPPSAAPQGARACTTKQAGEAVTNTLYRTHSIQNTFYTEYILYSTHSIQNTLYTVHILYRTHSIQYTFYREHILYSTHSIQNTFYTVYILYRTHSIEAVMGSVAEESARARTHTHTHTRTHTHTHTPVFGNTSRTCLTCLHHGVE